MEDNTWLWIGVLVAGAAFWWANQGNNNKKKASGGPSTYSQRNWDRSRGGSQYRYRQAGSDRAPQVIQIPTVAAKAMQWHTKPDGSQTLHVVTGQWSWEGFEGSRTPPVDFASVFRKGDPVFVWWMEASRMFKTEGEFMFHGRVSDPERGIIDVIRSPTIGGNMMTVSGKGASSNSITYENFIAYDQGALISMLI